MPITEHKWKLLESTTTKKDAKQRQLSFYKNNGKKINKEVTNFSSFNFLNS